MGDDRACYRALTVTIEIVIHGLHDLLYKGVVSIFKVAQQLIILVGIRHISPTDPAIAHDTDLNIILSMPRSEYII
jgi:hypothetical protein